MLYQLSVDLLEMKICVTHSREVGNGDIMLWVAEGPHGPAEIKFTVNKGMDRADLIIAATEAYYAKNPNKTSSPGQ